MSELQAICTGRAQRPGMDRADGAARMSSSNRSRLLRSGPTQAAQLVARLLRTQTTEELQMARPETSACRKPMLFRWREAFMDCNDVSPTQRHVLHALATFMDMNGRGAFPSVELLASRTGYNVSTVKRNLSAAAAAGWIKRIARSGRGQAWRRYEYEATIPPLGQLAGDFATKATGSAQSKDSIAEEPKRGGTEQPRSPSTQRGGTGHPRPPNSAKRRVSSVSKVDAREHLISPRTHQEEDRSVETPGCGTKVSEGGKASPKSLEQRRRQAQESEAKQAWNRLLIVLDRHGSADGWAELDPKTQAIVRVMAPHALASLGQMTWTALYRREPEFVKLWLSTGAEGPKLPSPPAPPSRRDERPREPLQLPHGIGLQIVELAQAGQRLGKTLEEIEADADALLQQERGGNGQPAEKR